MTKANEPREERHGGIITVTVNDQNRERVLDHRQEGTMKVLQSCRGLTSLNVGNVWLLGKQADSKFGSQRVHRVLYHSTQHYDPKSRSPGEQREVVGWQRDLEEDVLE